jgi:uncharacterized protein (UPF0332 family)
MMTENIIALVAYRLEQADESLEAARTLLDKRLIRLRQRSDYAAEYHVSRDDTEKTLKNAESFVDEVKKFLSKEM